MPKTKKGTERLTPQQRSDLWMKRHPEMAARRRKYAALYRKYGTYTQVAKEMDVTPQCVMQVLKKMGVI